MFHIITCFEEQPYPAPGGDLLTLKQMFMMENVVYTAPIVEVIEVEVEKGFATSQQEDSPWEDM